LKDQAEVKPVKCCPTDISIESKKPGRSFTCRHSTCSSKDQRPGLSVPNYENTLSQLRRYPESKPHRTPTAMLVGVTVIPFGRIRPPNKINYAFKLMGTAVSSLCQITWSKLLVIFTGAFLPSDPTIKEIQRTQFGTASKS
jgi:hypothetical protein